MPTRSGAGWPATSAAAPDTRRSSPPWRGPPAAPPPLAPPPRPPPPRARPAGGAPHPPTRGPRGPTPPPAPPGADAGPPLSGADAVGELVSVRARRDVPAAVFSPGPRQSVLVPDELIV